MFKRKKKIIKLREKKKETKKKETLEKSKFITEQNVWNYVNKIRRERKEINRKIRDSEKRHFKKLLNGTEGRKK